MIVCAALRYPNGPIVIGPRHFDHVMQRATDLLTLHELHGKPEQGFIDQNGDFLGRHNAWIEARRCGQVRKRVGGDYNEQTGIGTLYSENLY